ncbi:MAG: helicase-related protein, partial [Patescibacteria group bacterium]
DRFNVLIKSTKFFDALVGYFYTSGFHQIYGSLENAEKIRILIGISTNKETYSQIEKARQESLQFSQAETKNTFSDMTAQEMETCKDSHEVEKGIVKFIEWLKSKKIEIRAYPSGNIHAKLYIMSFDENDRDSGRVITGSSNFTKSGLIDNLEFNVELKNNSDYQFALDKFNKLWEQSVDVSEKYIETIDKKTWLNNDITPYQLYLKFLYEYFKDDINQNNEVILNYEPVGFKKLEYQEQAVVNAKKILEQYGGVFISDVVGLGKTYMASMLATQLSGRTLIIAPPVLLNKNNPGSWPRAAQAFNLTADWESLGKLEQIARIGTDKYQNIIIDEAHRFRTETNTTYEKLAEICRGKRVILVTATPLNNSPKDILSQIKLFQKSRKSNIPNLPDLETFFTRLIKRLQGLDRQKDWSEYVRITRENAQEIREKVLKYIMVRRTRSEIETYFKKDLEKQGLKFPKVCEPKSVFYQLNDTEDEIFHQTVEYIAKHFKFSRYTPMLPEYYKGDGEHPTEGQKNMGKFMKILFIKRLESSFYAFRNTLDRFIHSYQQFLDEYENGNVYVSKKFTNKIFEFLEDDNDEAIQRLIDEDKAEVYKTSEFKPQFKKDLDNDLKILLEIKELWVHVNRDPKLLALIDKIKSSPILRDNKILIFTESKETAAYLAKNLQDKLGEPILEFSGQSSNITREKVVENFDARADFPKNDYRVLVATEVLSEGVNLHRSCVVINYDIPWNPTRLMQRVGRINRVDTKFEEIYTYNFFPTKQANEEIKLEESARAKIHAFISMLGSDAKLLTEGEPIESFELFDRLASKNTITGEDENVESELKYLEIIRKIRDEDKDLFNQIKQLPKKARTAKKGSLDNNALVTYFRKGKLQKFYLAQNNDSKELDFLTAAKILESTPETTKEKLGEDFYGLLECNKKSFEYSTTEEMPELGGRAGRETSIQVLKILKAISSDLRQLTDDQEVYFERVMIQLEEGGIPKPTTKKTLAELKKVISGSVNPIKVVAVLQKNIPDKFLESHLSENAAQTAGPREVILSEYLAK